MRPTTEMPEPRGRRRVSRRLRAVLAVVLVALIVALLSLRGIAGFYTDFLWFDSLGFTSVWRQVLLAQVILALIFIGIMFALVWTNLAITDRLAPTFRPPGPEEEFVRRYHEAVGPRSGLVRVAVAGLFALFWGAGAGSRWQDWILFRNRVDFDVDDPQFGTDIGFYVFQLPFLRFLVTWLFTAFIVVLIVVAAAHYLNGGIRLNAAGQRVTPAVKGHLSVLLAILALIKAVDYWYQRYELTFSSRGVVDGASYTDVNAQLPAIRLLILISLAAAVLLIVNIWRRGWVLPVVAVGLWAFVAVAMGSIYPAVFQRLVVEPSESAREIDFIERNIEATRAAYGLDDVLEPVFDPVETELTEELFRANRETLENIRLLDPSIVSPTFQALEVDREQFRFAEDLDVDRYVIDGEERTVIVAARELNLSGVESGWENQHVAFTHGYGLAVAPANQVNPQGNPLFVVGGLPTTVDEERLDLDLDQPRIYVGEGLGGYAIVNTQRCEIDFALTGREDPEALEVLEEETPSEFDCERRSGQNQEYEYTGSDGVRAGGLIRRAAFALRFQDLNPIFSGLIEDDSRFIYNRDVDERVRQLAPFLEFDADPYAAIVDGRIVYIVDAYTTTTRYPYAQAAERTSVPNDSGLRQSFNYVRNSVKTVVDAYDGTVTFYVVDDTDPLIAAYQKAFPNLFTPGDEMPPELEDNLRYPEDLFKVQTNMWARYQLDNPSDFFDPAAAWSVALDPGAQLEAAQTPTTTTAAGITTVSTGARIDPFYMQLRLPGEDETEFLLLRPFVPRSPDDSRQELDAFMVARRDDAGNQTLVSYDVPGLDVDGPVIANRSMLTNNTVATRTTLLDQRGSGVLLGNMLTLPLDIPETGQEALLYVRPLYVLASGNQPALREVIVSFGDEVRICPSLGLALGALLVDEDTLDTQCSGARAVIESSIVDAEEGAADEAVEPDPEVDAAPTPEPDVTPTPVPPSDGTSPDALTLLTEADELFVQAEQALADGDLGRYQDLIGQAQQKLSEALGLLDAGAEAQATEDEVAQPPPEDDASPSGAESDEAPPAVPPPADGEESEAAPGPLEVAGAS